MRLRDAIGLAALLSVGFDVEAHQLRSDFDCMAHTLYHEARGEGVPGMIAVGRVILRRVNSDKWPDTICAVVKQKGQFSWLTEVRDKRPIGEAWQHAKLVAQKLLSGDWTHQYAEGALYYMNPDRASDRGKQFFAKLQPITRLGKHVFYR